LVAALTVAVPTAAQETPQEATTYQAPAEPGDDIPQHSPGPDEQTDPDPPILSAKAAILIDETTGLTLYEHNARKRRYAASTTKIMTALLCVERGRLDESVTVSERAAAIGEASINLAAGEKILLRHLLMGLLMRSGNDAAVAIAETVGGDYDTFIAMMNARAKELRLTETHFTNPHGLHHDDHYTTAYDLAQITRTALAYEEIDRIINTEEAVIPWPGKEWDRQLTNRNQLLHAWPPADGVKTGYTKQAGNCLIASATIDGWRLISVCLDCKDRRVDSRALLEWGFANFEQAQVVKKGIIPFACEVAKGTVKTMQVAATEELLLPVKRGHEPPRPDIDIMPVEAPVAEGQPLGQLWVNYAGVEYRIPLIAAESVTKSFRAKLVDHYIPAGTLLLLLASSVGVLLHGAAAKIAGTRRRRIAQTKRKADRGRSRLSQRPGSH